MAVLTGAGISAESGVPTFRDVQTGLWAKFNPQDLATPQAFKRMPDTVWNWYAWRRQLIASVDPNPGHFALAVLEQRVPDFTLITQNVVGFGVLMVVYAIIFSMIGPEKYSPLDSPPIKQPMKRSGKR